MIEPCMSCGGDRALPPRSPRLGNCADPSAHATPQRHQVWVGIRGEWQIRGTGVLDPLDDPVLTALREQASRPDLSLVEHLEFMVSEIDGDPHTLNCPRLHWTGIYLLRLIARERGLL